jgi:sulfate adenylyltransferase (ADP) / ATP adenylyltransferase
VPVPAEQHWRRALECSRLAASNGALVPLETETLEGPWAPFVVRRLLSRTPKHLREAGPRPNPFLPWETALEVGRLGTGHVLLLNKYPVQPGHLLIIPAGWKPQSGWLEAEDWQAVVEVSADTSGLWFFNSCAAAGASQPHRHLQLLPRRPEDANCPLESLWLQRLAAGQGRQAQAPVTWQQALSPRRDPHDPDELARLVHDHCRWLGLGQQSDDPQPLAPYNLLFTDRWLLTVRRRQEHSAGFSVNALGFAGYLLATGRSDLDWLQRHGPWALLQQVGG